MICGVIDFRDYTYNVSTHRNAQGWVLRKTQQTMRDLFRALIAGYTAKKLGGGCITTVILFIIIFWLLGYLF